MKKRKDPKAPKAPKDSEVIRLEDLAPRDDVTGGAGKRLFGERREPDPSDARPPAAKPGRKSR